MGEPARSCARRVTHLPSNGCLRQGALAGLRAAHSTASASAEKMSPRDSATALPTDADASEFWLQGVNKSSPPSPDR